MSFAQDYFNDRFEIAANSSIDARASFLTKTYAHLAGAVLSFVVIEALLLHSPFPMMMIQMMQSLGHLSWLLIMGGFMLVATIARGMARSSQSLAGQYGGLALYVVGEAVIFCPLLYFAMHRYPGVIEQAALTTLIIFGGLTAVVFFTRKDFSFLGGILGVASLGALAFIFCAVIFGFNGGLLFTVFMIVLACGYILYDTSRVLNEFRIGEHVSAALELFASVALLFWYIVQLFMRSRD